jgi:hypothetical protein
MVEMITSVPIAELSAALNSFTLTGISGAVRLFFIEITRFPELKTAFSKFVMTGNGIFPRFTEGNAGNGEVVPLSVPNVVL